MTWTKATTNPAGIDPGTERRAAAGRILLVGTLLAGLALLWSGWAEIVSPPGLQRLTRPTFG